MTGICFELEHGFNTNYLNDILNCLGSENRCWNIITEQSDVWADKNGNVFFTKEKYDTSEFMAKIKENHYVIFLKLQLFDRESECVNIHTKEEFEKSSCRLLMLVIDGIWCEIYTKDTNITDMIYSHLSNKLIKAELLDNTQVGRNRFDIF